MIITKKNQHKLDDIRIVEKINNINKTSEQKNLGIIFDKSLTFHQHHIYTLKSCYAIFHSLKHLKHKLSPKNKSIIIHSLIFSKLSYGNTITYPLNQYWTLKYNSLFRMCLSFIHGHYIHTADISNYKILTPENMYLCQLLNITFQALYNPKFPSYLKLNFQSKSTYTLRSQNHPLIEVPKPNAALTFQSSAATHYNKLPPFIRDITNYTLFKKHVKAHYLKQQSTIT
jgi:hypothetical protein